MKLLNRLITLSVLVLSCLVQQAFAIDNPVYTPSQNNKGMLTIEELYIGGVKTFNNVNVEFDFSNSTFKILGSTPSDNSIPAQAIETLNAGGLSVGLRGCVSKDRSVTCHLLLTSNEFDREISFRRNGSAGESTAFDNKGNEYLATKLSIANAEGSSFWLDQALVADLPTNATIKFENLSTLAVNFSQLSLLFILDGESHFVKFQEVDF
ncbi:MAG: hypothetical protein V3U87_12955 [Methylococcaceae bacterium]